MSEPDSHKVEEKKHRRLLVERRQWISAQTLRVAVAVSQDGRRRENEKSIDDMLG